LKAEILMLNGQLAESLNSNMSKDTLIAKLNSELKENEKIIKGVMNEREMSRSYKEASKADQLYNFLALSAKSGTPAKDEDLVRVLGEMLRKHPVIALKCIS
jgi:hypothetical protein